LKSRILAVHFLSRPKSESLPELAKALVSFTPSIGVRGGDVPMIYLDLSSTLHLFGGEERIVKTIYKHFSAQKITVRMALADDVATAGVLAYSGGEGVRIATAGKSDEALASLSIETLRFLVNPLSPHTPQEADAAREAISILSLLGIRTLREFARIPASTIGPRFGRMGVELHQRARGESTLPLHPFKLMENFRESYAFEFSVTNVEPMLFVANQMLTRLEEKMQSRMNGVMQLAAFLETEDGEEFEVTVPLLKPLRKKEALLPVLKERLSSVELRAPLVSFAIELSLPVNDRGGQFHLFDNREQNSERLDELLGRLVAGLGPTFISAAALRERYRPEKSWAPVAFDPFAASKPVSFPLPPAQSRPTVLLPDPQPLQVQRREGEWVLSSMNEKFEVASMRGPERLAGEWWDDGKHERDYFRVETKSGQLLWVFSKGSDVYLHGFFD
jgi:protein ImuB